MNDRIKIAKRFAEIINSDDIVTIILFGSVARGEDSEESDIDILIVSPVAQEIREEINNVVVDIVINDEEFISAHLMSEDHFNETKEFPFLTNVLEEGIVLG
ncbi:MAG: nucleotidyltransferase domain-containing protein [Methanobrevibacter thaueri]|nr:nucleotidyltransferase domain-containing protein [Methanobrevibacter thaueri]